MPCTHTSKRPDGFCPACGGVVAPNSPPVLFGYFPLVTLDEFAELPKVLLGPLDATETIGDGQPWGRTAFKWVRIGVIDDHIFDRGPNRVKRRHRARLRRAGVFAA